MSWSAALQLALRALWRNKTRAALTALGVIIGVASVIAMVAIGAGAQLRIAETEKYALACARTRPTDTVQVQKTFLELYKQYRGEYMGSLLTGVVEGMLPMMTNDRMDDVQLGDDVFGLALGAPILDLALQG